MRYLLIAFVILSCAFQAVPKSKDDAARRIVSSGKDSTELAEYRQQGNVLMLYQRNTGGWPKNIDTSKPLDESDVAQLQIDKERQDDSTIDNDATTTQLQQLAKIYQQTGDSCYKESFIKGIEYLLEGQYPNGGWPQVWPNGKGYQKSITYNDDAMVNVLVLLRGVAYRYGVLGGDLVSDSIRQRCEVAFWKGIDCVLETQIVVNGRPTIWCQQYDRETLVPTFARSYELPAFSPRESARIVQLLMEMPDPDEKIRNSIHGAMKWMADHQINGYRYQKANKERTIHAKLVSDATAGPLWARYYDLQTEQPFVCDRDGIPRPNLEDIGLERRDGYLWYDTRPKRLFKQYKSWKEKYDSAQDE